MVASWDGGDHLERCCCEVVAAGGTSDHAVTWGFLTGVVTAVGTPVAVVVGVEASQNRGYLLPFHSVPFLGSVS